MTFFKSTFGRCRTNCIPCSCGLEGSDGGVRMVQVTWVAIKTITQSAHAGDSQVSKLIEERKLKPTLAKTFPLAEAAAAHTLLETGHVRGKVVLDVQELKQ